MANPILNKYNLFGWQVQSGRTALSASTGYTWVPFIDEPSFKWTPHGEPIDQADRIHHDHEIYPGGIWYEGDVSFYLMPGCLSALLAFAQTRDAYNQCAWGTVILANYDAGLRHKVHAQHVKVSRLEFTFETGAPIRCTMSMVGLEDGAAAGFPADLSEWDTAISDAEVAPYICKETTFKWNAAVGASYSAPTAVNYDIRSCTVTIDNQLQDPADGMRFNGSDNPYQLYNEGGVKVTGSFSRDFIDETVYNAFRQQRGYNSTYAWYDQQYCSSLKIEISRGSSLAIELPRITYNDHSSGLRGSRTGRAVESVDFLALGARSVSSPASIDTDFPVVLTAA